MSLIEAAPAWQGRHRAILNKCGDMCAAAFERAADEHDTLDIVLVIVAQGDALADNIVSTYGGKYEHGLALFATTRDAALESFGAALSPQSEQAIRAMNDHPLALVIEGGRSSTFLTETTAGAAS